MGKGLSEAAFHIDMKNVFVGSILIWSRIIQEGKTLYHTGDVLKYYDEYYRQEPYYEEGRRLLEGIVETEHVYQDMADDKGV